MVTGNVCQMSVQCAGPHSPASYMLLLLEFSVYAAAGQALSLLKCLFGSQHELLNVPQCAQYAHVGC